MRKSFLALLIILLVLTSNCSKTPQVSSVPGGDALVRVILFWSESCPHCHYVIDDVLPPLEDRYGDQLDITMIETSSDPANYELYVAATELFDVPSDRRGVPAVFVGDTHLVGSREIPDRLEGTIQRYLDQGGVDLPPIPDLDAITQDSRLE